MTETVRDFMFLRDAREFAAKKGGRVSEDRSAPPDRRFIVTYEKPRRRGKYDDAESGLW